MSINVVENLVSSSKYSIKCPYPMNPEIIVVHNTANDASAKSEISYMINNNNEVSYHFAVDDKEVVQGLPLNRNGWHAGDGGSGRGNRKGIGVEICYSKSGGIKYKKAEVLAIKFIAQLLHERKWSIDRVKTHNQMNGKYCPHRILSEGRWDEVLQAIQKELDRLNDVKVKPAPDTKVDSEITTKPNKPKEENKVESISTKDKGKRVESIYKGDDKLNFYSKPTWDTKYKVGVFGYGMGWTIVEEIKVDGSGMFKVKNSKGDIYYITSSSKYVKVEGNKSVSKPKPSPKPTTASFKEGSKIKLKSSASKYATGQSIPNSIKRKTYTIQQVKSDRVLLKEIYSWVYKKDIEGYKSTSTKPVSKSSSSGIKSVGKIKMTGVKNFTYIYDKPNDNSKRLGNANRNEVFDIAGSLSGWYEVIYKGRRAYIKSKYASKV